MHVQALDISKFACSLLQCQFAPAEGMQIAPRQQQSFACFCRDCFAEMMKSWPSHPWLYAPQLALEIAVFGDQFLLAVTELKCLSAGWIAIQRTGLWLPTPTALSCQEARHLRGRAEGGSAQHPPHELPPPGAGDCCYKQTHSSVWQIVPLAYGSAGHCVAGTGMS